MTTATALTWRTIERGKRWRDTTGRFVIEQRVGGGYGPVPQYLLLTTAWGADSLSAHRGGVAEGRGQYETLAAAKAAAEVSA